MTARVTRILAELRERFEALYGHRLVRMVLFTCVYISDDRYRRGRGPLVLELCRERVPV